MKSLEKFTLEVRRARDGGFIVKEVTQYLTEDVLSATSIDEVKSYIENAFANTKKCQCCPE